MLSWLLVTDATLTWLPQASPEGSASFVLIGGSRLKKPSRVWTARSRLAPPNPLQSSLQTTRARRPARLCFPSCISRPIEGTQDPSHSRHNASGNRGTPKKKKKRILQVMSETFLLKRKQRLKSHSSITKIWTYSVVEQNNSSSYPHLQLCCVPPVADVGPPPHTKWKCEETWKWFS